jgi:hypothetical protein
LYDPSLGNLLLDVRNFGAGSTSPFSVTQDTHDSVSRVFADDVSLTTGNADSAGLVTQFDFNSVAAPEPSTWNLGMLGLVGIAMARRYLR